MTRKDHVSHAIVLFLVPVCNMTGCDRPTIRTSNETSSHRTNKRSKLAISPKFLVMIILVTMLLVGIRLMIIAI